MEDADVVVKQPEVAATRTAGELWRPIELGCAVAPCWVARSPLDVQGLGCDGDLVEGERGDAMS